MKLNIRKFQKGGSSKLPTFSLPEINIYPNNKWGDIARKQGLETARNWRKVREGTTAGINEFVNDPRAQFVQALLPLPEGLEYLGMVSRKAIKSKAAQLAAKQLNRNIDKTKLIPKSLPSNVGWAPTQSVKVIHDKNNSEALKLFFPERWDVINEGANPFGIWFQGKWGLPREGVKAAKAAKARALFANRPYRVSGTLKLDKPIQTVGEVSNRAALTKSAEQMGADGVIFNNVYDNGYSNNQVIFSFKDLIDGITTKKAAGK